MLVRAATRSQRGRRAVYRAAALRPRCSSAPLPDDNVGVVLLIKRQQGFSVVIALGAPAAVRRPLGGWCRTGSCGRRDSPRPGQAGGHLEPRAAFRLAHGPWRQCVSGEAWGWVWSGGGCRWPGRSCAGRCPASAVTGDAQDREPGEVGRGGEQGEVGGDLELPTDPGAAPAVAAAHEVADLALHLRAGCAVIAFPGPARLALAGRAPPPFLVAPGAPP